MFIGSACRVQIDRQTYILRRHMTHTDVCSLCATRNGMKALFAPPIFMHHSLFVPCEPLSVMIGILCTITPKVVHNVANGVQMSLRRTKWCTHAAREVAPVAALYREAKLLYSCKPRYNRSAIPLSRHDKLTCFPWVYSCTTAWLHGMKLQRVG